MGLMSGPTLTSGEGSVTKNYQIVDWVRSLQHGVNPAGRPLVLMPSEEFSHLTEEDLGDVIAFVKSVPPVNRASTPVRLGPVARGLVVAGKFPLSVDKIDHSAAHAVAITPAASVEYGHYLSVSCIGCHNPNFSGGKIAVGPPDWPPAANLTTDEHSEFKSWTEADFINALRTHKKPNGQQLDKVMPVVFGEMSDTELKALFAYLRSLPPKSTGAYGLLNPALVEIDEVRDALDFTGAIRAAHLRQRLEQKFLARRGHAFLDELAIPMRGAHVRRKQNFQTRFAFFLGIGRVDNLFHRCWIDAEV